MVAAQPAMARVVGGAPVWARLGGLVGVSLLLRIAQLGYQSVWEDEAYTLALAQRPFGAMLRLFTFEANGLAYALLAWPLARLSQSPEMLRAPALAAGVAAVPALWWAGRGIVGDRSALVASWLLAVSPMAIYYSQEARGYSLAALCAIVSWGCLDRALRSGGVWWPAYVAALSLTAYCNGLAPLMIAPAQVALAAGYGRRAAYAWLGALTAAAVMCGPIIWLLILESQRRNPIYWLMRPGLGQAVAAARELVAGGGAGVRVSEVTRLAALVFAALAVSLGIRGFRRGGLTRGVAVAASWAFVPLVASFAISQLHPIFLARYQIEALPGILLLVGVLIVRLGRVGAWVVFAAFVGISVVAVARQATTVVKADFRGATEWLEDHRSPGDPVLVDPLLRLPGLGYYDRTLRARDGQLVVAEWRDTPLPAGIVGLEDPGGIRDAPAGPPTPLLIARLVRKTGRLLIVSAPTTTRQGDIRRGAAIGWARRHCTVTMHPVRLMTVILIERCH